MLQGRLFSSNDTHRHRLGANWDQVTFLLSCTVLHCGPDPSQLPLPRGSPQLPEGRPHVRGGQPGWGAKLLPKLIRRPGCGPALEGEPVSWSSALQPVPLLLSIAVTGDAARWNSADEDNFTQAGLFYRKVQCSLKQMY